MSNFKTIIEPNVAFNRWTLIERRYDENGKSIGWLCRCDCGNEKVVANIGTVTNGSSTSCGCARRERLKIDNPMYSEETRKKVSDAVRSDPNRPQILKRAVAASKTDEVKVRRAATNQERYGGSSPAASKATVEKIRITNQERYGANAPAGNAVVRSKMADTCIARYGVDNIMKLPEYKKQISEAISARRRELGIQTLSDGKALVDACKENNKRATSARNVARKYGQAVMEEWIKNSDGAMSALESTLVDLLVNQDLKAKIYNCFVPEVEAVGGRYKPDVKVEDANKIIYVDADGLYYHAKKDKQYHKVKADAYLKADVKLFQFREDEILHKAAIVVSMVQSAMGTSTRIGARELDIASIDQNVANIFMLDNHLMGPSTNAKGLMLSKDGEPMMVMTYRKHKDGIDITRVATKRGYSVAGGLSRLLDNIIKIENPRFVQSFVDRRYATGHSLSKLGFDLVNVTIGWQWTDGKLTFNRLQCTANMDDRSLTEKQHAAELKWDKIYDAGQAKYLKYIQPVHPTERVTI